MEKVIPFTEIALVIPGHGATENRQSSQATRLLVERLRGLGLFAEVQAAFWKERPHFNEVLAEVSCRNVYVVPHFISEGYFTQEVIPRELQLGGRVTEREGFCIHYCDPVGCHPGMTDLLWRRAVGLCEGLNLAEVSLLIVGHGTKRNKDSAKAVREQVEKIQARQGGFGEVLGVYLDEAPDLADWHELTRFQNVVVLPYFIASGLHFSRDLPAILGMEGGVFEPSCEIRSKKVYCAQSVGGDPAMVDFVIDLVKGFSV